VRAPVEVKRVDEPAGYQRAAGHRLAQQVQSRFCPQCSAAVAASDRYCPSCGTRTVGAPSRSVQRRHRQRRTAVAVVTALVLIGGGALAGSLLAGGHDSGATTDRSSSDANQAGAPSRTQALRVAQDALVAWNSLVDAGRARRSQLQAAVNAPPDIVTGRSTRSQINRDFALLVAQIAFPREARAQADELIRAANDLAAAEDAYALSVRDRQPLPTVAKQIVGATVHVDSAERVLLATLYVLAGPVAANA
jgi:hypothetical protein